MAEHGKAGAREEAHIPGITHDPAFRPVGTIMVVVGLIWALFWGMALDAGTLGQPKAAAALILLGLLLTAIGKPEQQI
jgi:hypothetical protein